MNITIHRGTKEIGGSCVEVTTSRSRVLIDFGMPLINEENKPFDSKLLQRKSVAELQQSGILPRIQGLYKGEERAVDAIFISHSHMDHYGFLKYIHPEIPVYASEGAHKLIEVTSIFTPTKVNITNKFFPLNTNSKDSIGNITVSNYLVDHSAFDARAFLIEADGKRLFYSGDFRGHGRKKVLFEKMIKTPPKNIDCLLMEGSMLGRVKQEYKDESAVEKGIIDILKGKANITFLSVSSQNIDRIVSAYRACLKTKTTFVIDLYTAFVLYSLSEVSDGIPQYDWNNIRIKYFKSHADALARSGNKELLYKFNKKKIEMEEINSNKTNILMVLRDNSLFPILMKHIKDVSGSTLIYSMWDGYLTDKFKADCKSRGIMIKEIHTSGHAVLSDLKRFAEALNPKTLIPIHTFEPQKYKQFFKNVVLLKDHEEYSLN